MVERARGEGDEADAVLRPLRGEGLRQAGHPGAGGSHAFAKGRRVETTSSYGASGAPGWMFGSPSSQSSSMPLQTSVAPG